MTNRIRLADLAQQAGVSTATVSRVLNGKDTVAPSTRKAVLTALDLLGYERPERLRPRPSGLVGMIVPELTNPIFPIFAQNLESTMATAGYTPLLCTQTAGGITEDDYVQMLLDQHVAGIIFVSGLHADSSASLDRYNRLDELGIPVVTINGNQPDIAAPDFSTNDAAAIAQGVRHLASLGHTHIGLAMGPDRFIPSQQKALGFSEAMENLFPGEPAPIVNTLYTVEGGQAAAAQLIAMGCTAILCGSDIMALGAIRYCESSYLRVPDDVSIMGYDDSPLMAFTNPPLTTFRQPVRSMSEAALTTLSTLMNGTAASPRSLTFQSELIVRKSTGPCPN
ncbi:MAG: LacI family DNA-binding transcriptional regulator [Ancrocorticia sp.]|uniref:LacI family DNA-binding transcriptional regulator n=1 Tax=Ancrocorticia sp. TaxID=2593684 RepID=UPI003F8ECB4F